MSSVRSRVVAAALWMMCLCPQSVWAIQAGDILVADRLRGVIVVDAAGTTQTLLSGRYNGGYGFVDVVCDANGNIFAITDGGWPPAAVVKIDRVTDAQTTVSAGGDLVNPFSIQIAPDGDLLVSDRDPLHDVSQLVLPDRQREGRSFPATTASASCE